MRGFLIFLAVAFPIVLASPFFWSIVRMEFGAERVGYTDKAGVTQWATLGPKAAWPAWAIVPKGARLTVRANFEAAPGQRDRLRRPWRQNRAADDRATL